MEVASGRITNERERWSRSGRNRERTKGQTKELEEIKQMAKNKPVDRERKALGSDLSES